MDKQKALQKLFNAVVDTLRHPDDPLYHSIMIEHKNHCSIIWPNDTAHKLKEAIRYANENKMDRV